MEPEIRLTQFSHGAGCGCKISPKSLEEILRSDVKNLHTSNLIVGNETKDDAAVLDIGNGTGIVSTTDFFMPIVDDPVQFGRIAATNAISDIYAMGAIPIMAVAILGWPVNKIPLHVARKVVEGGRQVCNEAGIALSGGHSIDSSEPIFGLAVTGTVQLDHIKRNSSATPGCGLFLTKPLGVGVLTTAEKKGLLKPEHEGKAAELMCRLNEVGIELGKIAGVTAMTDVTGFGLLGHLLELCEGSNIMGVIKLNNIPVMPGVKEYILAGCCPGGTTRNHDSYGPKVYSSAEAGVLKNPEIISLLCDPQTSGGLLIAVEKSAEAGVIDLLKRNKLEATPIGYTKALSEIPQSGFFVVVED